MWPTKMQRCLSTKAYIYILTLASGVNIGHKIVIMYAYSDLRSHEVSNYIVMKT